MALSSVNPPSSYRLKQIGIIAECRKSRVELGCHNHFQVVCAQFSESMHMPTRCGVAHTPGELIPGQRDDKLQSGAHPISLSLSPILAPKIDFLLLNCDLEFQRQQAVWTWMWLIHLPWIFKDSFWGHHRSISPFLVCFKPLHFTSYWCSNCPVFDQWKPLQICSSILLTWFQRSLVPSSFSSVRRCSRLLWHICGPGLD